MSCISPQIHIVSILYSGFVIYTANPGSSLFSWHPTLMVIAFAVLSMEGIIVFSKMSSLLLRSSQANRISFHRWTEIFAIFCALGGFVAIWYNKYLNNAYHFKSWHGFLGGITLGMMVVQSLGGNIVYYPGLVRLLNLARAKAKFYHALSGMTVYSLVTITLITGMYSNWFRSSVLSAVWFLCILCPLVFVLYIIKQIFQAHLLK